MGQHHPELSDRLTAFIRQQHLFFVGTADTDGHVNVSPKGMDTLRVLDSRRVLWLNLTGSGNETAAHLAANGRITLMFCAFAGDPLILRVYGHASVIHPRDAAWEKLIDLFPDIPGARQIIDVAVELVQTSCGFGVPLYDYRAEREQLRAWADKKGKAGVEKYWEEKNQLSLDGKATGILKALTGTPNT